MQVGNERSQFFSIIYNDFEFVGNDVDSSGMQNDGEGGFVCLFSKFQIEYGFFLVYRRNPNSSEHVAFDGGIFLIVHTPDIILGQLGISGYDLDLTQ